MLLKPHFFKWGERMIVQQQVEIKYLDAEMSASSNFIGGFYLVDLAGTDLADK